MTGKERMLTSAGVVAVGNGRLLATVPFLPYHELTL